MKHTLSICLALVFSTLLSAAPEERKGFDWTEVSEIAIQERGRLKPLDTFSRETVQFITGKTSWKTFSAIECIFGWLTNFDKEWDDEPIIRVDYEALKTELGFEKDQKYFTLKAVRDNPKLMKLVRQAAEKERTKEKLSDLERKTLILANQKNMLEMIISGDALTIFPNPKGMSEPWFALTSLNEPGGLPYPPESMQLLGTSLKSLIDGFLKKDAFAWKKGAVDFGSVLRVDLAKGQYPTVSDLKREIHYNHLRPFRWAWVLYTLAFILILADRKSVV